MTTREKGVATVPCPNCGNDLKTVAMPDGAIGAEACTTCYGKPEKATKAEPTTAREKGTNVKGDES